MVEQTSAENCGWLHEASKCARLDGQTGSWMLILVKLELADPNIDD
jgi:hypothetical protein